MSAADDSIHTRRARLKTSKAATRHFAIVTLDTQFGAFSMRLRYVPDRDLLDPDALGNYVHAVAIDGQTPEALAEMILDDINDQVIPCWLDVTLRKDGTVAHEVRIEDRQPRWDDKGLLARLGP